MCVLLYVWVYYSRVCGIIRTCCYDCRRVIIKTSNFKRAFSDGAQCLIFHATDFHVGVRSLLPAENMYRWKRCFMNNNFCTRFCFVGEYTFLEKSGRKNMITVKIVQLLHERKKTLFFFGIFINTKVYLFLYSVWTYLMLHTSKVHSFALREALLSISSMLYSTEI